MPSNFPHIRSAHRPRIATNGARLAGLLLGLAAIGVAAAPAADAHVRVKPDSTAAGSFSELTFRVPNESDTASTTKLVVTLPADTPFAFVSTKPVPGWTASTTKATLPKPVESHGATITEAVNTVTWTADAAAAIKPGEYQVFSISAGPLPEAGTKVLIPAVQTYSDGEVVSWDEPTPESGEEPQHPSPEFVVTAGTDGAHGGSDAEPTTTATTATGGHQAAAANASSDGTARTLGVVGCGLGLVGLGVGAASLRRRNGQTPAH